MGLAARLDWGSGFNDSFVDNTSIPVTQDDGHGYAGDCGDLAFDFHAEGTAVMTANGSLSIYGTPLVAY